MTQLGSPIYTAPEVASGHYNAECDLWSIGVVMYEMLVGQRLFQVKTKAELDREINGPTQCYELPPDMPVSEQCRSFIKGLLVKDPARRFTFEQAFTHPFVMPQLVLYHLGRPSQLELPVLTDHIELGDVAVACGARNAPASPTSAVVVHWRDVLQPVLSQGVVAGVFASSAPDDFVVVTESGQVQRAAGVVETDTLKNGFRNILALCLPTRDDVPAAVDPGAGAAARWGALFPAAEKRRVLEEKLHSTAGNSVESMNVRFEEIQLVLGACNDCARQINLFAFRQKMLCTLNETFFANWKPLVERALTLQRTLAAQYSARAGTPPQPPFPVATIIPTPHPDIPAIGTFSQQSDVVTRLVVEGKRLRNETQDHFDQGLRTFVREARSALSILDSARAHLEEFYPLLSTALALANREWNYTAAMGTLFARLALYIAKLEEIAAILASDAAAGSGTGSGSTAPALQSAFAQLKTIAAGCPQIHLVCPSSSGTARAGAPATTHPASASPVRGKSPSTAAATENAALRAQNEALHRELDEAHKEIARLNAIIASLRR